jgi:hypothetical protein
MKSSRRKSCRILSLAMALCATFIAPGLATAGLVIDVEPAVPPGTPPDMSGGGNLPDVMNAAASFWMAAFPDVDWTIDLQYQWGGVGAGLNGQFVNPGYQDGHIISGDILFNNTTVGWYADPDPLKIVNPAFGPLETTYEDYYGNLLNTRREWNASVGSPAYGNMDLLMIAEHEIGHALGIYNPPATVQHIVISSEISEAFAGYTVDLDLLHDHIENPFTAIMASGFHTYNSQRKGISAADILAIAEINGWANPNLNPYAVPEPSSAVLLLTGIGLLARFSFTRRR